ncbi:methenyltetrahydromethanopterin cyclohydrolase, partial [Candidatus Bathyarchaeota archaeon]|nr:methenyltetrahydromethanopterin cyclohydrolase [Candidatus Bathyarchaeota archaeon]
MSINKLADGLAKNLIDNPEYYRVGVTELPSGATVIDTGVEAHGGYDAGLMVTRIAMGGLGKAE